jgi:AraC family transcriptional regulator
MRAFEETVAALGQPAFVRAVGLPLPPRAIIARWQHGPAVVTVAPSDTIRLAMSLVEGRNARDSSGGAFVNRVHGGSISIFSPTEGARVEVNGNADVVQLFLDQAHAEEMLDAPLACPPMFDLPDDHVRTMIMRVLVGSDPRGPDHALAMEVELNALVQRIGRHATQWRERAETPRTVFGGGLSPAAFRRVEAMIQAAVDNADSATLRKMADTVGLSVTHFVRAFRRHTGCSPHKYVVRRRMNRAISLLRGARLSIGEVADRVGYATTAHFVAAFRSTTGVTPGALRDTLAQ